MIPGTVLLEATAPSRVSHDRLVLGDDPDKEPVTTLIWTENSRELDVPHPDLGHQDTALVPDLEEGLITERLVTGSMAIELSWLSLNELWIYLPVGPRPVEGAI